MRRALELAALGSGMTSPNPMVGAVLVKRGRVIGEGYHRCCGEAHAEVAAFLAATGSVAGATLYVTLEPCSHQGRTPPCAPMLITGRIARVVAACADPNPLVAGQGFKMLRASGVKVDVGLFEEEARRLNEHFFTYHRLKRPFIISKWAMTLDGRIATESGDSRWISNEKSRLYVHELRARVDAVLVGIGTVILDNPMLNVRLKDYEGRQPRRVILDGNLRVPLRAKCLDGAPPGQVVIVTSDSAPVEKMKRLEQAGHEVLVLKSRRGLIDIREMIASLPKWEIQSVLCEGGSSMHGALLQAKLVDKVVAFVAPKLVGGEGARGPVSGWGIPLMRKALNLQDVIIRHFDDDVCVEGYVPDSFRHLKPLGAPAQVRRSRVAKET